MDKKTKKPLTPEEEMLRSYNAKMRWEGILKSSVLGLICGFVLSAIVSIISFATQFNALWIALVLWGVSAVGFSVLFYFKKYRPNLQRTAARVDGVGLDERVITMIEFAGEDSVLLQKQRQDTQVALQTVSTKHVKIGVSKLFAVLLAVIAALAIFMMSYSTVLAVNAEEKGSVSGEVDPDAGLSDEDKIIRDMLQNLRDIIKNARISEELRSELYDLVADLERSLKPEDTLQVKIAKISATAEEIHRRIQEYLNRSTIAEELQKYDPTYALGKAIESEDLDEIEKAFQKMYDDLVDLVLDELYDYILETALDIDQALKDAINTPPKMQKALEDLRDAYLAVLPPDEQDPEHEGEQPKTKDEVLEEIKDALEQAKDAMQDAMQDYLEDNQNAQDADDQLQDAMKDAMEQLGGEFEDPEEGEEQEKPETEDPEGKLPESQLPGEEEGGQAPPPSGDGEAQFDTVIDGETSYKDVYDDYYDEAQGKLESGDLDDDMRDVIEDYFDMLK